ncbi:MAG: hypothetical protein Q4C33_03450 [bacterium]|nr:hypothetical protein [bacterium]
MNKKKTWLVVLVLILIYSIGGIYYNLTNRDTKKNDVKQIDSVDKYNYVLKSNATELQKTLFNELKDVLKADSVNDDDYAKVISKMFVTDLYTLSNKVNKYDVGGTDLVLEKGRENFKLNVEDTLYKYLEDNSDGNRNQILPEVIKVNADEITDVKYKIDETEYDAKKVVLSFEYKEDLGYDDKATVILIKVDNYYYVVESTN